MEIQRLSEWCRLRKEYLHRKDLKWTNAYIAEKSGVSEKTIYRFLSGNIDDIKISTAALILKVLVNGTWGQYPCALAAMDEADPVTVDSPALVQKCEHLQSEVDALNKNNEFLRQQIKFNEDQMNSKDKTLVELYDSLKNKDRVLLMLGALLVISLSFIIGALIIDKLNPNIGFFWKS